MSSAEFYDNYIEEQVKSGINDRIIGLYNQLIKTGLSANTSVLEIGCGIGTLTSLLVKKVTKGPIEATDISPKSIAFATQYVKASNLRLTDADILTFEPNSKSFDRILLFDVLEHIPLELHEKVFQRISRWMNDDSFLLINIPNPAYILFDQQNNPAVLQETDQPVYLGPLASAMETALIDIRSVETYSVWVKDDYRFIIAQKRKPFEEKFLSRERNVLQKAVKWVERKWRQIKYPYPPAS